MSYGGADLSTVDPNPSMDDYASATPATDYSGLISAVGQWGSTIASIATGNPGPATQPTVIYTGTAPASGTTANKTSQLLIIGIVIVAAYLLFRSRP